MSKEKVLLIVESPSKIKSIKKYLPDTSEYIVLPSIGHIADLSKKGKHNLGVNIDKNFEPNYVVNNDKIDVLRAIIDSAKIVDRVLLCTDPDREGECISYHIAERIKTTGKPIKRIEFHEITKKGIEDGLKKERDLDMNLIQAAITRRVLDRIVGYMASPFIINRVGKNTSAGRVQSVALRKVVERENKIQKFNPEEYWVIKANLCKNENEPFVATVKNKETIKSGKDAKAICDELNSSSFIVSKVEAKPKKKNQPAPIDTAKLQVLASGRYNLSSSRTMDAAQSLYQDGMITYIRTDSLRLSPEAIVMARDWIKANHPKFLPTKPNVYKNKDAAQDAHEAIRPTDINNLPKDKPESDMEKVYKIVWEIFVACQMTPAIFDTTTVIINSDKNIELRANGRVLKELGWLAITNQASAEKEDDSDESLPNLSVKDKLSILSPGISSEQKFTQPPSRFKEATLIEDLKESGIGRPSTYESIMTKICDTRSFVTKKNNVLHPTEEGKKIVELLTKYFSFMEYGYTANMEGKLDLIASGKNTYLDTIKEFFGPFKTELDKAYKESEVKSEFPCDKCGSYLIVKKSSLGYFLGCSSYPTCKNIVPCEIKEGKPVIVKGNKEKEDKNSIKCPKCDGLMIPRNGKYGEFFSCSNYPTCKGRMKKPFGKKCPECGNELYKTTFSSPPFQGDVLCCMGYPGCNYKESFVENEQKKAIV